MDIRKTNYINKNNNNEVIQLFLNKNNYKFNNYFLNKKNINDLYFYIYNILIQKILLIILIFLILLIVINYG